jgi:hypothetical protein
MRFDGQYFHYLDKWLFALARANHVTDGVRIAKSSFPYFFEDAGRGRGGIRWKLSVNASRPSTLPATYPNDDTLNALIVYSLLDALNKNNAANELSLKDEIKELRNSLRNYNPRVTEDPLGWGLEAISDQYVMGHPRTTQLRLLASKALHTSHLSLPFRLYGAMIGASVDGHLIPRDTLEKLKEVCTRYQFKEMEKSSSDEGYEEEHSAINRVMLAMVLLSPGALKRREGDPVVEI